MAEKKRLLSLDVFRGLAVATMMLVDYPGSWEHMYGPLQHASWNGVTPTDLIFPSFLFIVGVSIVFSLAKHREMGLADSKLPVKIFKRGLVLILLGVISNVFIYNQPLLNFSSFRIPGVLQRIAIVYLVCALLFIKLDYKRLAWLAGGILIVYWGILTLIPVPGFGMPDLGIRPEGNVTNLAAWLDKAILGKHVYEWSRPWDPEGILSTLPCLATTILGVLTGLWLRLEKPVAEKSAWLFVYGCFSLLAGYLWGIWFPLNKNLWTSSYVLFSAGWAVIILACFYWLIDAQGYKKWIKPLQAYGLNAIAVFFCATIVEGILWKVNLLYNGAKTPLRQIIYQAVFVPLTSPVNASLMFAIANVFIWMLFTWILYKKKIFFKA